MASFEWIATIVGAIMCLVYSWFLIVMDRSHGLPFKKVSLLVGLAGMLVLAGMAIVGPPHISELEGVNLMSDPVIVETDPNAIEATLANKKRRSLAIRMMDKIGRRPSKNHLPWEYPDGKLAWVTKSEYEKLRKEEKEGGR